MKPFFSDFVLLFTVVDPIGVAAMFATLSHGADRAWQRRMALRGAMLSALILVGFIVGGGALLGALGIGIPAFRIAGGLLLLLLSVDMILAWHSGIRRTTADEDREAAAKTDISVFPLAFPLIAGPGAMTTVLLMSASAGGLGPVVQVVLILAAVLAITLACLMFAPVILRLLGETGTNVISRLLGVILAALAVQYMLDGLNAGLSVSR